MKEYHNIIGGPIRFYIIVTASTVGYGDLYPQSPLGRVISLGLIVLGIISFSCTIALLAAKISGSDRQLEILTQKQDEILALLKRKKIS